MYFYLALSPDASSPDITTLYSAGNLTVSRIIVEERRESGLTDYAMTLMLCEDITLVFGHVSSLSADLFGDTSSFKDWHFVKEYGGASGRDIRRWDKDYDVRVTAGEVLGTAGGNPGQWAWDFAIFDQRHPAENVANPDRYGGGAPIVACPLSYFEEGPVLDQLVALVNRDKVEGEALPCGSVIQDLPGTAQGNWYLFGTGNYPDTIPAGPHLALVHDNIHPLRGAFSVGTSVSGLRPDVYHFNPQTSGRVNLDFSQVTADDNVYCYDSLYHYWGEPISPADSILLQLTSETTLRIEKRDAAECGIGPWAFQSNFAEFER